RTYATAARARGAPASPQERVRACLGRSGDGLGEARAGVSATRAPARALAPRSGATRREACALRTPRGSPEARPARIRWIGSVSASNGKPPPETATLDLKPGDLVRVRSASEVFSTLDASGTLDGMPFMPEMLKYCGRVLPVTRRADTTCAGAGVVRR